jgi:hypothetical protein
MLVLVEPQCALPRRAGFGCAPEGGVGVAQPVECVGFVRDVACCAVALESLLVVVECGGVLAGVVGDAAEAVQGQGFSVGVVMPAVQRQGGPAVRLGLPVLGQQGGTEARPW